MMEVTTLFPSLIKVPIRGFVKMNILLLNYRGALNANFKIRILEMVMNHHQAIMVTTETRARGERVERIVEGIPFNGFYATDTIGYAGGLWLLWKKEKEKVLVLSATEQGTHALVKVFNSNITWLISSIYASP